MDAERSLLSKAIQSGKFEQLVAKGVDESYFYSDECKEVWRSCIGHLRKFKSPPSFEAVRKANPNFGFEVVTDAFDYVFEEFVKQTKRRAAIDGLRELARAVDDPGRVLDIDSELLELGSSLAKMFPQGHASRYSQAIERIEEYLELAAAGTVKGIPMGLPEIDDVTYGIRNHEFVSVVGWQGVGKSLLSQHICFSAYLAGFTSLIISLEMEAGEIFARFDTMANVFTSRALQRVELGEEDIEKWRENADRASRVSNDIVIVDNVVPCTVEKVHSLCEQYAPDLCVVDYVSLMDGPKGKQIWEKVTDLTQGLKQVARDPNCPPIISVAQTNIGSADDGAKLQNIAYSRSIGQDSDIVLGLHQDEKMKARHEMEVRMLKNRRGKICDSKMYWNQDKMEFRPWSASDMFSSGEDSEQQPKVA